MVNSFKITLLLYGRSIQYYLKFFLLEKWLNLCVRVYEVDEKEPTFTLVVLLDVIGDVFFLFAGTRHHLLCGGYRFKITKRHPGSFTSFLLCSSVRLCICVCSLSLSRVPQRCDTSTIYPGNNLLSHTPGNSCT